MRIKVFTAPHLHEALAKVRQDMGPEALILDRQQSEAANGDKLWHVHAALDNPPLQTPAPISPPAKQAVKQTVEQSVEPQAAFHAHHQDATLERLERIVEGLGNRESSSLRQALKHSQDQDAFDHLIQTGILASHAFDMASDFAQKKPLGETAMRWGKRVQPDKQRHVLMFTGPSGCGKSTLIAKLAAYYSMKGIRVALLSTDTERMGGVDMLKAYAGTLGIDFYPLRKVADVDAAHSQTQTAQLLLIDTEGWSPRRDTCLKRQSDIWNAMLCDRRFLLLPANMDEEDGMQQLKHNRAMNMTDIAFSKLDETQKPGKIVNWSIASTLPVSYCSFGPEVPEQMGWLNPRGLTALLSKHAEEATA